MKLEIPIQFDLLDPDFIPSRYDKHIIRKLSDMNGQYLDKQTYKDMLSKEDSILYQVFVINRPEVAGELIHGISIVNPGKIGDEFYMTKGHFHTIKENGEIYYVLKGCGYMIMETPEGETAVEELRAGRVLYVPPRWAHRSVNVSSNANLVLFFAYPGNSGHDYGTIENQGFRKLVVEQNGHPIVIDNPRYSQKDK
jgi:glucose-6-phosphate isomerase, archaeal